jgi:hypothetical protein
MYSIHVTAFNKKNLPEMMLFAIECRRDLGMLDGLIHAKDDITQEISHGWGMTSHWDTPENVFKEKEYVNWNKNLPTTMLSNLWC